MKKILYFSVFSSFLGAKVLSIPIGGFQMSLFRLTFLVLIFLTVIKKKKRFLVFKKNNRYSILFMFVWLMYGAGTFVWAVDLSGWFRNLYFLFIGISTVIILSNLIDTERDIIQIFHAFQWGVFVQGVIGWYEIFTRDYQFVEIDEKFIRVYIESSSHIPIGMSGNPNNFATLMFIGVFVSYMCYMTAKNKRKKILYMFCLFSEVLLVFFTKSRANIIALLLSGVFMMFMKHKLKLFCALYCGATVLIVPGIIGTILKKMEFASAAVLNSNSIRINLIRNGFTFLIDTCGFGVGNGQIEAWMSSSTAPYFTEGVTNMHNWWMEILVAYGIVIFIGYLLFYFGIFKNCFYNYKRTDKLQERVISISICAILVGYIIASISSSSIIINESIWVFFAICVAYQGIISSQCMGGYSEKKLVKSMLYTSDNDEIYIKRIRS